MFRGDAILLNCNVNLDALSGTDYFVKWSKDGEELLDSRSVRTINKGNTSYIPLGNREEGEYLLFVDNAQDSASGEYICEIINTPSTTPPVLINTLYVMRTPTEEEINVSIREPVLLEGHSIKAGTHVVLQCDAPHIGVTFRIKWIKNGDYVGSIHDHITGDMLESRYAFTATPDDNNAIFDCIYFSPLFPNFQLHHRLEPLNVVFQPIVTVHATPNKIFQGDDVELYALASGNPDSMIYQWSFQPLQRISELDGGHRIQLLDLKIGQIDVTCTVLNAEGATTVSETLIVMPMEPSRSMSTFSQAPTVSTQNPATSRDSNSESSNVQLTTPKDLIIRSDTPLLQKADKLSSTVVIGLITLSIALVIFVIVSIYLLTIKSCRKNSEDQMQILFHRDTEGTIHIRGVTAGSNNATNHYSTNSITLSSNGSLNYAKNSTTETNGGMASPSPPVPPRNQSLQHNSDTPIRTDGAIPPLTIPLDDGYVKMNVDSLKRLTAAMNQQDEGHYETAAQG